MGYDKAIAVVNEVQKAVKGKDEIVKKVIMAFLAGGHVLMEDIPGVGKTTMALAFAKAMALKENRMQFTTDVLPSDVVGFSMFNAKTQEFEFKEGAVMCNLFLADEINRTSSKTQSALLESMEEGQVTVDGVTRPLPKPFLVIATQNPAGSAGTQLLPESQLDRFMIRLTMGYPDVASEVEILKERQGDNPLNRVNEIVSSESIIQMQEEVDRIHVDRAIYDYIAMLSAITRKHPMIELGISPRGTLALASMARAHAYISGRGYVTPGDVQNVFPDVARH
ncbi:MAG: MoxR family ATPase, partial [Butyrivibrio sp.]|nr:MoxR family ATPase [Butyrivibrio sp.]